MSLNNNITIPWVPWLSSWLKLRYQPYTAVHRTTAVFRPVPSPLRVLLTRMDGRWTVVRTRLVPVQMYGRTRTTVRCAPLNCPGIGWVEHLSYRRLLKSLSFHESSLSNSILWLILTLLKPLLSRLSTVSSSWGPPTLKLFDWEHSTQGRLTLSTLTYSGRA